jgi:outer membrane protein assembly factor BamB
LTLLWSSALRAQSQKTSTLSLLPTRPVWSLALNNGLEAPPAFNGTHAYFPLKGDLLAAYDLISGKQLWLASADVLFEPAVGEGLVFVVEPGALVARYDSDGEVVWQYVFDEPVAAPLVWENGWLIVASREGSIFALRAKDGDVIWRRDLGSPAHARPVLSADRVYVPTEDGRIVALQVANGEPAWERALDGAPNEILALDDRLYVGSVDRHFYCVDSRRGIVLWRYLTGGNVIGRAAYDDRRVYFVAIDNILRALDRRTGGQIWKRALPLRPNAGPVKATDVLLVAGLASTIRAFKTTDGNAAGEIPAGNEVAAPPQLIEDAASPIPFVVFVTYETAGSALAVAVTRMIDPPSAALSPLPNLVPVTSPSSQPTTSEQPTTSRPSSR